VQGHLSKLRYNFDAVFSGKLTVSEMYELKDAELLSSGIMGTTPHKHLSASVGNMLKSAGSALGGDEIDSECRTEDGELYSEQNKESQ